MRIITNEPTVEWALLLGTEGEEAEIVANGYHGTSMIMAVTPTSLKLRGSIEVKFQDINWIKFLRGLTREARKAERA